MPTPKIPTLVWLRTATDTELEDAFQRAPSALAEMPNEPVIPAELIWWELCQRRADQRERSMVLLTWAIAGMTLISTVFVALAAFRVVG